MLYKKESYGKDIREAFADVRSSDDIFSNKTQVCGISYNGILISKETREEYITRRLLKDQKFQAQHICVGHRAYTGSGKWIFYTLTE